LTTQFFVHVDKFDWVFDCENVVMAFAVDLVDHGRKGGGLTRTVGPVTRNQAREAFHKAWSQLPEAQAG